MKDTVIRYINYGQACFYLGLILCVIILPGGLSANDGISFYGVHRSTIAPFIFALLGPAYYCIRASELVTKEDIRPLRYALGLMGLFTLGVLVTPYTIGRFINDLHMVFGACLFIVQLLLTIWLINRLRYDYRAVFFGMVELAGGIAAFIYLSPPKGFLLQSQVVFQMGFSALIIYALRKLQTAEP